MARSQLLFLYDSFRPVAQIFLHGFAAEADDDDLPLRSRRLTARSTCSTIGTPPTLCRTLGMLDFILVPFPAAKISAIMSFIQY